MSEELYHSAMYDNPHTFSLLLSKEIHGREYLYQKMAEAAAITGNLPVMEWIMQTYIIDWQSVATIARSHNHNDVAMFLTGQYLVPFKRDLPSTSDMEEDRDNQTEYWQNTGYWTSIHSDQPIEPVDVSPKHRIMDTRDWVWHDDPLDVPTTTMEWIIRP